MEEPTDLWTQTLDLLSQLVTPDWNALILLLPFAMLGLALLIVMPLFMAWRRGTARNRSRVAARRRPPTPPGIHLPGPSPWPLIAPVAGGLLLLALVFPSGGLPFNLVLFVAGLGVGAIAIGGWLWDAGREWRHAESGPGHGDAALMPSGSSALLPSGSSALVVSGPAAVMAGPPALELPEGIHLPGPSPWPFFVPIGGGFVLLGLIFGPMLMLGGLLMVIIAVVGWYRDAGHEYLQVEAGHFPEPTTRDPERAFPKSLVPLFGAIAVAALLLTIAPSFFGSLPGNAGGGDASPSPAASPDAEPELAADNVLSFSTGQLVVPADTLISLTFDNRQAGVPHNVFVLQGDAPIFEGETITGPAMVTYEVPALAAGQYRFICSIHPPMTGTVEAK